MNGNNARQQQQQYANELNLVADAAASQPRQGKEKEGLYETKRCVGDCGQYIPIDDICCAECFARKKSVSCMSCTVVWDVYPGADGYDGYKETMGVCNMCVEKLMCCTCGRKTAENALICSSCEVPASSVSCLTCAGFTEPPEGDYHCDDCTRKRKVPIKRRKRIIDAEAVVRRTGTMLKLRREKRELAQRIEEVIREDTSLRRIHEMMLSELNALNSEVSIERKNRIPGFWIGVAKKLSQQAERAEAHARHLEQRQHENVTSLQEERKTVIADLKRAKAALSAEFDI